MRASQKQIGRNPNHRCKVKFLAAAALISLGGVQAQAALFNPGQETVFDTFVSVANPPGTIGDITGIELNGNASNPTLSFNGGVEVNISDDSGRNWNGYGVWASSSMSGPAFINLHNSSISISGTTNIGVGIVSGTDFNPTGGVQPEDHGTTVTLTGTTSLTMSGSSVIGIVAGSVFGNNTNGGGADLPR